MHALVFEFTYKFNAHQKKYYIYQLYSYCGTEAGNKEENRKRDRDTERYTLYCVTIKLYNIWKCKEMN